MYKKVLLWIVIITFVIFASACAAPAELAPPLRPAPTPRPAPTLRPTPAPEPRETLPPLPPLKTFGPLPTPTPTPAPTPRVSPTRIYFPSFEEETPIVPAGIDKKNNMATISEPDVATWYRYGATPGDAEGNAIVGGHVRWSGRRGDFALLHDIIVGDSVLVTLDNGEEREFTVAFKETYMLDDVPEWVMDLRGEGRLTLITCAGDYDYSIGTSEARTVVVCRLTV